MKLWRVFLSVQSRGLRAAETCAGGALLGAGLHPAAGDDLLLAL